MCDIIRLLDSEGEKVLDSVLTEYEDSFCLENFGDLIELHATSEPLGTKKFIIARVQTWDCKQPEKAFYSYYDAFQLNKILFQTQVYLGKKLIHRLHVLNPLTNTDIIGNVQYFMVRITTSPSVSTPLDAVKEENETVIVSTKTPSPVEVVKATQSPKKVEKQLTLSINTNYQKMMSTTIQVKSPGVLEVDTGQPGTWVMVAPAVSEFSEESVPQGSILRRLSMQQRRFSTNWAPRSAPIRETLMSFDEEKGKNTPPAKERARSKSIDPINFEINLKPRKISIGVTQPSTQVIQVLAKPPLNPLSLKKSSKTNKMHIQAGVITRFAVPITPSDIEKIRPPTSKSRRRSLSYHNSVSASDTPTSFQEWLKMVRAERKEIQNGEDLDFDDVEALKNQKITDFSEVTDDINSYKDCKIFDAVLFATDNDYLESSKTRAIFKCNAVSPEDVKLFEMKPYTGDESTPLADVMDDNSPFDCCFPSTRSLQTASPCMRIFHKFKCYFVTAIFLIALFAFLFVALRNLNSSSATISTGSSTKY
ncbi:hypothetical protein HK096_008042 [Nowakowskiella sp. JEL0078]|nr:hypothetical protein HK096_008042 [Nowakowskiella sp. JEL0078]